MKPAGIRHASARPGTPAEHNLLRLADQGLPLDRVIRDGRRRASCGDRSRETQERGRRHAEQKYERGGSNPGMFLQYWPRLNSRTGQRIPCAAVVYPGHCRNMRASPVARNTLAPARIIRTINADKRVREWRLNLITTERAGVPAPPWRRDDQQADDLAAHHRFP